MTPQELKEKGYFAPEKHEAEDCRDFEVTGQCSKAEHYKGFRDALPPAQ